MSDSGEVSPSSRRGVKRKYGQDDGNSSDEEEIKKTKCFLNWCKLFQLNPKVTLSIRHCASGLGMVAKETIASGERLFYVPDEAVLCPENSRLYDALCREGMLTSDHPEAESMDEDGELSCSDREENGDDGTSFENNHLSSAGDRSGKNSNGSLANKESNEENAYGDVEGEEQNDNEEEEESEEDDDKDEDDQETTDSRWAPLLLTLVSEYTAKSSTWHPYLRRMADSTDIDLPHAWPVDMRTDLLQGLGIGYQVQADMDTISKQHTNIALPFIQKYPELFGPGSKSLALYQKLSYFVMANSFTDTRTSVTQTVMVPMADVLNHHWNHNAELEVKDGHFEMCAIRQIEKGEEVYNTYGRSGLHDTDLLRLYGFTIGPPLESKACAAYIPLEFCREACLSLRLLPEKTVEARVEFLTVAGVIDDISAADCLGQVVLEDGECSLDSEFSLTLKVLAADSGWSDEDFDFEADGVPSTKQEYAILKRMCEAQLTKFKWPEDQIKDMVVGNGRHRLQCRRLRSALHCCWEQLFVLRKMLELCEVAQNG